MKRKRKKGKAYQLHKPKAFRNGPPLVTLDCITISRRVDLTKFLHLSDRKSVV